MIILNSGNALKIAAAALGVSLLSACGNTSSNNNQFDEIPDSLQGAPLQLSENVVNDMIQNISSPVEMANQILKS